MASAPVFYHAAAGMVSLSRGLIYPYNETGELRPLQKIGVTEGGAIKVMDFGMVERFWDVKIKNESKEKRDALLAFFADSNINYAAGTFTFYPEGLNGTYYTVRLWSISGIDFPQRYSGLYDINITLREEIV